MTNKPTIPSVGDGTITIKQAGVFKGTFTTNQSGNAEIDLSDSNTTYNIMNGATTSTDGASGLVPAPSSGEPNRYLRSDGTWAASPDTDTWNPCTKDYDGYEQVEMEIPTKFGKRMKTGTLHGEMKIRLKILVYILRKKLIVLLMTCRIQ